MSAETAESAEWEAEPDEGYFVSITDMMIGLLFLFIIMLMYFALQLHQVTTALVTAEQTRSELLQKVAGYMRSHNVKVEIDLSAGVLRFPDDMLFDKAQETPKPEGIAALDVLAEALDRHLPCYSYQRDAARPADCKPTPHSVEVIIIEGHTDSDRLASSSRLRDNWDLSSARATNTFRILTEYKPKLLTYLSAPANRPTSQPLFSVAGYADQRPIERAQTEAAKAKNRRIDIRFVMAGPEAN